MPVVLCADCEEIIPQKRLNAVPGARYCVACQASHDEPLIAVPERAEHPEDAPTFHFVRGCRGGAIVTLDPLEPEPSMAA